MKLLIVGNVPKEYGGTYTTGVTNVIIRISEEFDKSNTNYQIFSTNSPSKAQNNIIGAQNKLNIKRLFKLIYFLPIYFLEYYNKGFSVFNSLKHIYFQLLLKEVIDRYQPSLIHVHSSNLANMAYLANRKNSDNILLTFHGYFKNDKNAISEGKKRGLDIEKLYSNIYKGIKITDHFILD